MVNCRVGRFLFHNDLLIVSTCCYNISMTNFHINSDRIGIAGDWHCNIFWAKETLKKFHDAGVTEIFQLGDFGIWGGHDGASFILKIAKWLKENGQTLYVTLGNHEDYVRVNATPVASDGTQWYQGHENIKLLPRGFRGSLGASKRVSWVSLGGANSIDFKGRREGISWWREESITVADVYKTVEAGKADFMFCHDAPAGVTMPHDRKEESAGWHPDEVRYSNAGREMLRQAVDVVQPRILFHGHHHCYQDVTVPMKAEGLGDYSLRSIGLACDGMKMANIVFDIPSETYSFV
jgi:Icc-related predicted phosphoesterase